MVDMSALTKVARRELHHTRSPFKAACSVPGGVLKSTLDCVDGYHGVEVAEEDRDKMSFITTGVQSSRGSEFLPHHPNLDLNFFPGDNSYFCLQTPK